MENSSPAESTPLDSPEIKIDYRTTIGSILNSVNVKTIYYIDDIVDKTSTSILEAVCQTALEKNRKDILIPFFLEIENLKTLPNDLAMLEISKAVKNFDFEKINFSLEQISSKDDDFGKATNDYFRYNRLQTYFPDGLLKNKSPNDWSKVLDEIKSMDSDTGGVLILFDKELNLKEGERVITGLDLITELSSANLAIEIYCLLISHSIESIDQELMWKKRFLDEAGGSIEKEYFYPLSKERLDDHAIFGDGLKKAVLNKYFENLKDLTESLANNAYKETINSLHGLDTYDFNHVVLKSSQKEGTWEANTLIRVLLFLFDENLKKEMGKSTYIEDVNKLFLSSKATDESNFEIDQNKYPYLNRHKLRRKELYYEGDIINKLYLPISNGDVFEIKDEQDETKLYVLVSQDCDTILRTNGERVLSQQLTIFPIRAISEIDFIDKSRQTLVLSKFKNDVHQHKYVLDYFIIPNTNNDIYCVDFSANVLKFINPDVLDLVSFNSNGRAILNKMLDSNDLKLCESLRNRASKLKSNYSTILKHMNKSTWNPTSKQNNNLNNSLPQLYLGKNINTHSFTIDTIEYPIKRVFRIKYPQSAILLQQVNNFNSRYAEEHDFLKT